jgi:hypothetical protein
VAEGRRNRWRFVGSLWQPIPPSVAAWLFVMGLTLLIPLFVFSLAAMLKLRWKLISIFAIVWVLLVAPFVGFNAPLRWMGGFGFQLRTLLAQNYLSGCRLTEFVENGVKQTVGFCRAFDRGTHFDVVVYDTTGEFVLPASQRTPEWKQAMSVAASRLVVSEEDRARHIREPQ